MNIAINDTRVISSIQKEFNSVFPYLKSLAECRKVHSVGEITIQPLMTVQSLEQIFLVEYGLGVQVFRKSGSVWLETTVTDSWTLAEQNSQGEALSKLVS